MARGAVRLVHRSIFFEGCCRLSTKRIASKIEEDLSRPLILGLRWEYARVLQKAPKAIRRRVSTRPNILLSEIGKLGIADPETWRIHTRHNLTLIEEDRDRTFRSSKTTGAPYPNG
jgi:hypothetical protein